MPLFSLWFLRRKAALNTSPTHLCHAVRLKRLQAYYISVNNDSVSERIYMYITYQGCEIGIPSMAINAEYNSILHTVNTNI